MISVSLEIVIRLLIMYYVEHVKNEKKININFNNNVICRGDN